VEHAADVEPATRTVVTDGIRDHVRAKMLDQLRVAGRAGGLERCRIRDVPF
jgi:hypothetical protein